jgi:hypothetical protein
LTTRRRPRFPSSTTDARRRSKSKGSDHRRRSRPAASRLSSSAARHDGQIERIGGGGLAVLQDDVAAAEGDAEKLGGGGARRPERPLQHHLAAGQCPGLVGEEHVRVAQVLDAHEPPHQRAEPGHPPSAGGQAHGHDRGQELRGQADGDGEREEERVQHGPTESRVDHEDAAGEDGGDHRQQSDVGSEAPLEGRRRRDLAQAAGHRAEAGRRTGGDHVPRALAAPHDRSHVSARRESLPGGLVRPRLRPLLHRIGLSGQGGLVDAETARLGQAKVGGDDRAHADPDEIAGDELGHGHLAGIAASNDHGAEPRPRLQRCHGSFASELVDESEAHAEPHDREDDDPVDPLVEPDRECVGDGQQAEERTGHLTAEDGPPRGRPPPELVAPGPPETRRGLGVAQSGRTGRQTLRDLAGGGASELVEPVGCAPAAVTARPAVTEPEHVAPNASVIRKWPL